MSWPPRHLVCVLLATAALSPARGQEWAVERLDASPRHHEWVEVAAGEGRAVRSFVAYPETSEPAPAVIVLHENRGSGFDGSTAPSAVSSPHDEFLAALAAHCGQAFAGRVVTDVPEGGESPFAGQTLVMHVRRCEEGEVRVPFHVGENRSRTWVLTRTPAGLRLEHDHRHEDGTPDAVSMYGGETVAAGTAERQEFPVNAFSVELFEREGLAASVTNTWAMELEPGRRFLYELSRPGGRLFQVEFDLATPVEPPPPPWGG